MKHQKRIKGNMGKHLSSSLGSAASALLLLSATHSWACGQGGATTTITGIPTLGGSIFEATALNAAGQVAGYSTILDDAEEHAFLYSGGSITDLGTLGGNFSQGLALNASGQVVGKAKTAAGATHAVLFGGGSATDLGTLSGRTSFASAINNAGLVSGESDAPNGETHGFTYTAGALTDLGTLGRFFSSVAGLNNAGVVAGDSFTIDFVYHAYLATNGTLVDLGDLGGDDYSSARALNDAGMVVGEADTADFDTHAFAYANGVMSDLGTLGGSFSSASAVNQAGQVIGQSTTASGSALHGFYYSNGVMSDLGTLGGDSSTPRALNNLGQVVGESRTAEFAQHAFLWQNGTLVDLNTLLPADSGWELISAKLINDAGRIVGEGFQNGVDQWFTLDLGSGANHTPVAVAGPNQNAGCGAQVTLDGSGSSDPDGDALSFRWSEGAAVLGTNAVLTAAFDPGVHTHTLTVNDPCGESAQTNVLVTVTDTTPPTFTCPGNLTAGADANCQAAVPNLIAQMVATDNCTPAGSLVITQSPAAGTLVELGQHPVTVKVADASGNVGTCSTVFTVIDTTAPVIVGGPAPAIIPANTNCLGAAPDVTSQIVATDNCTAANQLTITQNPVAGTFLGLGQHPIVVTVKDAAGNNTAGSTSFTVVDTTAPVILNAPAQFTVSAISNCLARVPSLLTNVLAVDNCTPANLLVRTQTPAAGTMLGLGQYSITVTVRDFASNSAAVNIPFIVRDTTPPTIISTPAPMTISSDGNCQGAVPNVVAQIVAIDNCTPANQLTVTQTPAAGTLLGLGRHFIGVTATDAAGNSFTTSNLVFTVTDTTAPAILSVPAPITVSSDTNCQGTVPNVVASVVASDNCTPANLLVITQSPAAGTTLGVGTHSILVSVMDRAGTVGNTNPPSGNIATTNISFTVADTTAPTILSTPAPITVSSDSNCQGTVPNVVGSVVANDNCTPANALVLTQSPAAGTFVGLGANPITVTVKDAAGNASTASVSLTVVDTTAPSILSSPAPLTASADANCQAAVPNVLASIVASDNCTPANLLVMTQTPAAGTILGHGQYTITVTVKDAAGNSVSRNVPFTVADTTAPAIQSVTASQNLLSPPNHRLVPITVSVVARDNCDAAPVSKIVAITCNESVAAGDIQITGNLSAKLAASRGGSGSGRIYTITVSCTDASGNSSTATTTVTVPH